MRLGVLDIGSNTVHLLLVDAHFGARPVPFATHKRPLQLVSYLDGEGNITEPGQAELVSFVQEAWEFAANHKAEDMLAFCTSAIREAANGPAVLARVEYETGVVLTELTGEQEAAMTFSAVRRWYGWGAGNVLDFDIGGGSFEIAMGTDAVPAVAKSLPLGAGRLTRGWLSPPVPLTSGPTAGALPGVPDPDEPPSAKSIKVLRKHIRSGLKEAVKDFHGLGKPDLVTGTSKTFRSLARITGAAPAAAGPFVRRQLRLADLSLWTKRLAAMAVSDRVNLPGVSDVRAEQMLAGAMVAEAAMDIFKVPTLHICPWALREGLILRRFDHILNEGSEPLPAWDVGHVELATQPVLASPPESAHR